MKSFIQYLFESKFKKDSSGVFNNEKWIDDHLVHTSLSPRESTGKHFNLDFSVDGNMYSRSMRTMNNDTAMRILKHVHGSYDSFHKSVKPDSVSFAANEHKKFPLYTKFAQRIAEKHGGTYSTHPLMSNVHTIKFDKTNK